MDISWTTHEYGRAGELEKLSRDRNNSDLGPFTRSQADKAHAKIVQQLKDKRLMAMRERLIKAAQANDEPEQHRIQLQMRAYTKEEAETGLIV